MDLGVFPGSMTSWVGRMMDEAHHEHVGLGKYGWKQDMIGQRLKGGVVLKAGSMWGGYSEERHCTEVNPAGRIVQVNCDCHAGKKWHVDNLNRDL